MKTDDIPLKSPIKLQQEMQKKILNFPKFVRFLGHFWKKQCFWKMGMAGIKQLPRPSKIASFSWKLNEGAFKNHVDKILTFFDHPPTSRGHCY